MFRGKKYQESAKQIDKAMLYDPKEGLELICKTASAKFDETVELHVKLGVDSRHADQQVRGAIVLPNGTGKSVRGMIRTRRLLQIQQKLNIPGNSIFIRTFCSSNCAFYLIRRIHKNGNRLLNKAQVHNTFCFRHCKRASRIASKK